MLALPNDILTVILGHVAAENATMVVNFASCSSLAAEVVCANKKVILANRQAVWAAGRARVLTDSRTLFPEGGESRRTLDARIAGQAGWHQEWWMEDGATEKIRDVDLDFHFGPSSRSLSFSSYGDILTALWLPVTADRVQLIVGGTEVINMSGALIRALAPPGAKAVNVLPLTLGRGMPVTGLRYHTMELQVDGACRVRASFASFASFINPDVRRDIIHRTSDVAVTYIANRRSRVSAILPNNEWHILKPTSYIVDAIIIVVDDETALDTVTVCTIAGMRTWDASLLRAERWHGQEGVWQGLHHGFIIPVVTTHNFGFGGDIDIGVRLTLRGGCATGVTFAIVEYNRMRLMSGMSGMMYAVP